MYGAMVVQDDITDRVLADIVQRCKQQQASFKHVANTLPLWNTASLLMLHNTITCCKSSIVSRLKQVYANTMASLAFPRDTRPKISLSRPVLARAGAGLQAPAFCPASSS
jgi:hypothetical protein